MMSFKDLLSKPLPSANAKEVLIESVDEDEISEKINPIIREMGYDPDNLPDTDLDEPVTSPEHDDTTADTTNDKIASQVDQTDPTDAFIADDLSISDDSETQRIDDRIQRVATPVLLKDTMSDDELDEFTESVDSGIAMSEDFLTERTIVKFDKQSRYAQLKKIAILSIAREKKNPLYKKLTLCWKMEKMIERKFEELYGAQAAPRVKEYLRKARASKSKTIRNAAQKISSKK